MAKAEIIAGALEWAAMGTPVFPCNSSKAPVTTNGHLDATTDPAKIRLLFASAPEDCMVGGRMGAAAGIFALDFDLYKAGASDYMDYLSEKGLLNDTRVHTTKSGGLHIIYAGSGTYPNCKPHVGVEVKGEGGYIILPPSQGYEAQSTSTVQASPLLIEELLSTQRASSKSKVDELKHSVLTGDSFHDPLAQIAARRSAQGWSVEKVTEELVGILKASVASVTSHPRHKRWSDLINDVGEELTRITGSSNAKYNSTAQIERAKDAMSADTVKDFVDGGAALFNRPAADHNITGEIRDETKAVPQWGTEVWPFENDGYFSGTERNIFDQSYVAYPIFAERESVLIAAEPKAGKTAIALKLAMQVAYGEDLGSDFIVSEPRPVLYFTLEGVRAVEMRIQAELNDRKDKGNARPERDMLFVVDRPHNFATPDIRDANGAKIVLHNEMCKREWDTDLGLIVIDTLTKAMPGKDQNSVEDTSELFELIGFLRNNGVKATIVFIHHLSKQGNVRGSTNIEAEVDVVLGVTKDKKAGLVYMDVRRARSMDEDTSYAFKFDSHYLGETVQGHKLHAPLVRLVDAQADTSSAGAVLAARFAKCMDELVKLGVGTHGVAEVVHALADVTTITPPSGKRPNYKTRAIQDVLGQVFGGQINFAYGNWIIKVQSDNDGMIDTVTLLRAA